MEVHVMLLLIFLSKLQEQFFYGGADFRGPLPTLLDFDRWANVIHWRNFSVQRGSI